MNAPELATEWAIVVQKPEPDSRKIPVFRPGGQRILLELQHYSSLVVQNMAMIQLHDSCGQRKYLTIDVRDRFLVTAKSAEREVRNFCLCLAHTSCGFSAVLEIAADRFDLIEKSIAFRSLKKHRDGVFRLVLVLDHVLEAIDLIHAVEKLQKSRDRSRSSRHWSWHRSTGWHHVARILKMRKFKFRRLVRRVSAIMEHKNNSVLRGECKFICIPSVGDKLNCFLYFWIRGKQIYQFSSIEGSEM